LLLFSFDGASRGNAGKAAHGNLAWRGHWIQDTFVERGLLYRMGRNLAMRSNNYAEVRGLAFAAKPALHSGSSATRAQALGKTVIASQISDASRHWTTDGHMWPNTCAGKILPWGENTIIYNFCLKHVSVPYQRRITKHTVRNGVGSWRTIC